MNKLTEFAMKNTALLARQEGDYIIAINYWDKDMVGYYYSVYRDNVDMDINGYGYDDAETCFDDALEVVREQIQFEKLSTL